MAIGNPLISPVKECKCVYYQVYASEKIDDHWEHRFSERLWQDFILYDPQYPQTRILVQTQNVNMLVRGVDDGRTATGRGAVSFFESEAIPPGITKLLERHNFRVETDVWIGKLKKEMNYVEESFSVGEQIACLGIVRDGVDHMGCPVKILTPVRANSLDESYFNQHFWNDTERNLWSDLLGSDASLITTDDPTIFQGVIIQQVPQQNIVAQFQPGLPAQIQQQQFSAPYPGAMMQQPNAQQYPPQFAPYPGAMMQQPNVQQYPPQSAPYPGAMMQQPNAQQYPPQSVPYQQPHAQQYPGQSPSYTPSAQPPVTYPGYAGSQSNTQQIRPSQVYPINSQPMQFSPTYQQAPPPYG